MDGSYMNHPPGPCLFIVNWIPYNEWEHYLRERTRERRKA